MDAALARGGSKTIHLLATRARAAAPESMSAIPWTSFEDMAVYDAYFVVPLSFTLRTPAAVPLVTENTVFAVSVTVVLLVDATFAPIMKLVPLVVDRLSSPVKVVPVPPIAV